MINSTPRQKYLYLVARLYELAAEFTDSDLTIISENFVGRDEPGISKAIDALMLLHGVQASQQAADQRRNRTGESRRTAVVSTPKPTRDVLSDRALFDLFGDQTAFPRVQDIARVIPGRLHPQPKEGRSRFIRRAIKHIETLDAETTAEFRENLALELEKKPHNFISQWKNLIREL
jgi:hypothetical protein